MEADEENIEYKPILIPKNKFLFPTDGLGKMKSGLEFETGDFPREIRGNDGEFEIIEEDK